MSIRLTLMLAALWWGSLTTVGFGVVPLLFAHLPTPALAGQMAAKLFSAQAWVSISCGLSLLLLYRNKLKESSAGEGGIAIIFILAGLLLALLLEYGVAPRIVARENLRLWHGVGSALYAAQWLCAGRLLWRLGRT